MGTLCIFGFLAYVLIDPRATHSFVSCNFIFGASVRPRPMGKEPIFALPTGDVLVINMEFRGSYIQPGDVMLEVDLIPLDIIEFDVILGMDWMARHHVVVDYSRKEVVFQCPGQSDFTFGEERKVLSLCLISTETTRRLLKNGCVGYLAHKIDSRGDTMKLEDIPTVQEFPDVC